MISIDVTTPDTSSPGIVGAAGGTASDAAGDSIQIAAGALPRQAALGIARVSADAASVAVPAGFDLLAAIDVDLVGQTLAAPAQLSIATPSSVSSSDQVVIAFAFSILPALCVCVSLA